MLHSMLWISKGPTIVLQKFQWNLLVFMQKKVDLETLLGVNLIYQGCRTIFIGIFTTLQVKILCLITLQYGFLSTDHVHLCVNRWRFRQHVHCTVDDMNVGNRKCYILGC
jgi:hypothetical protein